MFRSPLAAYSPATNSSESPGRNATMRARLEKDDERQGGVAPPLNDGARVPQESDQIVDELHSDLDSSRHAVPATRIRFSARWTGSGSPQPTPDEEAQRSR